MTTTYLPPLSFLGGPAKPGSSLLIEAVPAGPAYARSGRATRWHLIRSATDSIKEWSGSGQIERTYLFYCGQFGWDSTLLTADDVPDGEPTCGTCWGRREGVSIDNPDLLFTPRQIVAAPKSCPGSRSRLYADTEAYNYGVCLVCRDRTKLRATGGPYRSDVGLITHAPGPGLIEACQFHGWRDLTVALDADDNPIAACICKCMERPA